VTAIAPSRYTVGDETLRLHGPLPDAFTLETRVRIEPDKNTQLSGLYKSKDGYFTQCEAQGFRRITFFPDRPDVMARYTCTIEADKARFPQLLSNGNPVAAGDAQNGRHWAKWEDPFAKPCYLFALVAAKLDVLEDAFITASGRRVRCAVYVEPGKLDQCGHAMAALKKSMKWDEERFGLEMDLDHYMIVAVGDFNMGAMENKGLNIFNTKYVLARPDTATDTDYQGIDRVVAHEYFHNWTGNRVTCRDWFQLSLKEGLTVYRDQEFGEDLHSRAVTRIQEVRTLRVAQFPEDAGPMAHPIRPASYAEINNFYTATVYEKGAQVIRMIETLIGRDNFRKGMDLYFARHDGQAVTCEDFVAAMQDASNTDLTQFRRWYARAGTPRLKAEGSYDPAAKRYTLTLTQSLAPTAYEARLREAGIATDDGPLHIPVAVGLVLPDGSDAFPTRVLSLTAAEPELCLRGHFAAAGGLGPARLLGARASRFRPDRRRAGPPDGARLRPLQPLGGRPAPGHPRAAGGHRGRRPWRHLDPAQPGRGLPPACSPMACATRPSPPKRWPCPPNRCWPRKSSPRAASSTPRPSTSRASTCAAISRPNCAPPSNPPGRRWRRTSPTRPTAPRSAAAPCAMPASPTSPTPMPPPCCRACWRSCTKAAT
jgi:aminopeptidase N